VTTAQRLSQRRTAVVAGTAARAFVAAVLAAVVTFSADHTPSFGLVALGVFGIVFGAVSAIGVPRRGTGPLLLARAAVFVVGGIVALALVRGDLEVLVGVETALFLVAGALELIAGLRRGAPAETAGDAIVVGGLELLVGVMLVLLDHDAVFTVGVLGAWAAVVAVYLGIAAVSLRGREARQ
jgi:hypothetical protein